MSTLSDARAYYADFPPPNPQRWTLILRWWRRLALATSARPGPDLLPAAVVILSAAQAVAAEMADPYLTAVLADADLPHRPVNPEAFAGTGPAGDSLASLLTLPTIDAKQRIAAGVAPSAALRLAE